VERELEPAPEIAACGAYQRIAHEVEVVRGERLDIGLGDQPPVAPELEPADIDVIDEL
jgi:hypothetical protein